MIVKIGNKLKQFDPMLFNSIVSTWVFNGNVPRFFQIFSIDDAGKLEKIVVPDEYYDNWKNNSDISKWAHLIVKASEYNG